MNITEGPFIDIIMPNYNKAEFISEAVDSVVKQTYKKLVSLYNERWINRLISPKLKYIKIKILELSLLRETRALDLVGIME